MKKLQIKEPSYVQKQIKKIGKLIFSSSFIYAIYNLFVQVVVFEKDFSLLLCSRPFDRNEFILTFLFGNIFSGPLWYLTAYLQFLIFIPLIRNLSSKMILVVICLSYVLGLFVGKYLWLWTDMELSSAIVRNVFTMAVPFVLLGILIRKEQMLIFSMFQKYAKLFFLFVLLNYLEYGFILKFGSVGAGDFVFTTIFLVVYIFMFALAHPNIGRNTSLLFIGQKLSLNIYIYHALVLSVVYLINGRYQIFPKDFSFPVVLGLTILLALCMDRLNIWNKTIKELSA